MASPTICIGDIRISHPIIQAPMVGVSTPELAAAVSNAGGLGSIGIGASTVEAAQSMIDETRRLTSSPFNVNVFCHKPAKSNPEREKAWLRYLDPYFKECGAEAPGQLELPYPSFIENEAMLEMLLETRPAVVSFHFGLPDQSWIDALKFAGITLLATATNLSEAYQIERAGLAAIVSQGREAGGHSGVFDPSQDLHLSETLTLVQQLATHCALPVIAAGGIMDGRGIKSAMELGAIGAQMGTAFVLCPESAADNQYRAAFRTGNTMQTRITSVVSGRPARGFVNRWCLEVDNANAPNVPDYPIAYAAGKALNMVARAAGKTDFNAHWAGQGAVYAREMHAEDLVRLLVEELNCLQSESADGFPPW